MSNNFAALCLQWKGNISLELSNIRSSVLILQATQLDDPMRYGVALLSLQVQGQNVYAPVFSRDDIQVMRTEAFPVGEVIATVQASDLDPVDKIVQAVKKNIRNRAR